MTKNNDAVADMPEKGRKCPVCSKQTARRYRPFCSARCADVDLGRWFTGQYSMPGEPAPENDVYDENENF